MSAQGIGFIGLGRMGFPMAGRLVAAGHRLRGFDVAGEAVAAAEQAGVVRAASAAEAARGRELVITMLPDPPAVRAAAAGADGVLAGLERDALWIEMTSSDPGVTRELAEAAAARGAALLDAPVSGGVLGAREGTLTIACGGPAVAVEAARPVLTTLADRIVHVSERPGDGDLAKTINNMLSAANLTIAAEALTLGIAAGVDPDRLMEYVNGSSGASSATQVKIPRYVLSGTFDAGFTLGQYLKDLRIAMAVAERCGLDLELAGRAAEVWREVADEAGAEQDHTLLVRLLVEKAGVRWPRGR